MTAVSALLALLLSVAPPLSDELTGAPPASPRLTAEPVNGQVPARWFLDDATLQTTTAGDALFDASSDGPRGEVVGTACRLTAPASFHLARIEVRARGLPWRVSSYSETAYVPRALEGAPTISIWRDETHDKNAVEEIVLGVLSAGLSLLRLSPTLITTVAPPPRGRARSGAFSVECRAVGRQSVEAALAAHSKAEGCDGLSCLRDEAALLGPEDPRVVSQAQAIVDARAREAAAWRSHATWKLRSLELVAVKHCGSTCVVVTLKNVSPVARPVPRFDGALDVAGRGVTVFFDPVDDLEPGEVRKVRATVALDAQLTMPAAFPVVLRTADDFWVHPVPAAFTEDRVEYDFRPTGTCDGSSATAAVTVRRLTTERHEPSSAWLSSGERTSLSMPFGADHEPWTRGEARAWSADPKKCPTITAVSGRVPGWQYVVLP